MTKIYYSLKRLEEYNLTDLKYRMIKYRMNKLLKDGLIVEGDFAYKINTKWYIHYSLIDLFQATRKHSSHNGVKYRHEITINLKNRYDLDFHILLGEKIILDLKPYKTIYRIERNIYTENHLHIHFATSAEYEQICDSIRTIGTYLELPIINNKNTHISKINNQGLFTAYIDKAVVAMNYTMLSSNEK